MATDKEKLLFEYTEKKSNLAHLAYGLSIIGNTQLVVFLYHDVGKSFCFCTHNFQPIVTSGDYEYDNDDDNDRIHEQQGSQRKPIIDGKKFMQSCIDIMTSEINDQPDKPQQSNASGQDNNPHDHFDNCMQRTSILIEKMSNSSTEEEKEEKEKFEKTKFELLNTVEEISKIGDTQCLVLIMNYNIGELTEFCTKYFQPLLLSEDGKRLIKHCIDNELPF